jgi:predicted negative regulator of RcsB-dependent stress response
MVASDEEQIERIRDWWSEHGRTVIAGAVLGVAGLVGWQGWASWQSNQTAAAAVAFAELEQMVATGSEDVVERARTVATEHDAGSYAVLAWLIGAGAAVEGGDLETAETYLLQAREQAAGEAQLLASVDLRLARVRWARGEHEAALAGLDAAPAGFEALFAELRGDIHADQGDLAAARTAYDEAAELGGNALLEMKRDALPREARS